MPPEARVHTFADDDEWETVARPLFSPLRRRGLRVTPPVPLRVLALGALVDASEEGWINVGGPSSLVGHVVQARGRRGETVRIELGVAIDER